MLLPAAVNYPCQPSRIKHRSSRPVHSLTRAALPAAPHKLQNKWLVVSPDVVPGLVWSPQHQHAWAGSARRDGGVGDRSHPESAGSCWLGTPLAPTVLPSRVPCQGVLGIACAPASSRLTSCSGAGGRTPWGRREVSVRLLFIFSFQERPLESKPQTHKINKINSCNFNNHCVGFGRCYSL